MHIDIIIDGLKTTLPDDPSDSGTAIAAVDLLPGVELSHAVKTMHVVLKPDMMADFLTTVDKWHKKHFKGVSE